MRDRKTRDTPTWYIMEALFNGRLESVVMVAMLPWKPLKINFSMKLTVLGQRIHQHDTSCMCYWMEDRNLLSWLLCCHGNQANVIFSWNLQFWGHIFLIIRDRTTRDTPKCRIKYALLNERLKLSWLLCCHGNKSKYHKYNKLYYVIHDMLLSRFWRSAGSGMFGKLQRFKSNSQSWLSRLSWLAVGASILGLWNL